MITSAKINTTEHNVQLCVIGGGIAGMLCAVSAARHGVKVLLMQDRPVLGGNASSEIRMWIRGARGRDKTETGIIEELALENIYRNPTLNFHIWDSVLYGLVYQEKNITLLMNCSCLNAEMYDNKDEMIHIKSVTGWQLTTQQYHKVYADIFADCSGDSILAPLTGAEFRMGREGSDEFGESIAPSVSDNKTMGMSCLIQARNTGRSVKFPSQVRFTAPEWAKKYTPHDFPRRMASSGSSWIGSNFWWMELGGCADSIADTENLRDELLAVAMGTWDCIKNSGAYENADMWELDWVGFLPGKRESRRYVGQHVLCQKEVESGGKFSDTVAYGGWSMDDHDPEGMNTSNEPTTYHPAPSPYGIPLRCMISANVENLVFAGRNISATHAALSSTRVMATCGVIGQAVGTAVSVALNRKVSVQKLYPDYVEEIQHKLQIDDCWLPDVEYKPNELMKSAVVSPPDILTDGINRGNENMWRIFPASDRTDGNEITVKFNESKKISRFTVIFDSDINRDSWKDTQMDCIRDYPMYCMIPAEGYNVKMPDSLAKTIEIDFIGKSSLRGESVLETVVITDNHRRLVTVYKDIICSEIRLRVTETWGSATSLRGGTAGVYFIDVE